MLKDIIKLIRPKHWIKNAFVLAPLIFSFQFLILRQVVSAINAFFCFSFAASSVYILNDIIDREKDKLHPIKSKRPIAAGRISARLGFILSLLLAAASLALSFMISLRAVGITLFYLIINLLYSLYLKQLVIVDVFTIALGFVLRVIMGAIAIQVDISAWIILATGFLSLFLGFTKRYNEIFMENGADHRAVLGLYSKQSLLIYITISAVLTIVVYAFYTVDSAIAIHFFSNRLIYSLPIVLFGVFRYIYLVLQKNVGGDVAEVVTRDKYIIIDIIIWLLSLAWAFRW